MEDNSMMLFLEFNPESMEEFSSLYAARVQEILQLTKKVNSLEEELSNVTDQLTKTIENKDRALDMLEMAANMNRKELIETQVKFRDLQQQFDDLNTKYLKVHEERKKLENMLKDAQKTVVKSENQAIMIRQQFSEVLKRSRDDINQIKIDNKNQMLQLEKEVDEKWNVIRYMEHRIREVGVESEKKILEKNQLLEYYQNQIKKLQNDAQDYQQLKENFDIVVVENVNLKRDNQHLTLKVAQLESSLEKMSESRTRYWNFIQLLEIELKRALNTCKEKREEIERNKFVLKKQLEHIECLNYQLSQRKGSKENASKEKKTY